MTELTILMPVYNGEKWLDESIGSVLEQSYDDFEFLICNDGSVDGSLEKIKSFHDDRIKLINFDNNTGKSMRTLIENVNTKYTMCIDQDDRFCRKDAFEYAINCIKSNDYDLVNFAREIELNENGNRTVQKAYYYGNFSYCGDKLFEKFFPCDNQFLFHSKIFLSTILKNSIPYDIGERRFSSGDNFYAPLWFFNSKRYLNIATDEPIYEYKTYTGIWGSKLNDYSAERIGEMCISSYNAAISCYNRMNAIRKMSLYEINNLLLSTNISYLCQRISMARRIYGNEHADNLIKVFHAAFCADGIHLLNGVDTFIYPEYIKQLEDIMRK